MRNFEVKIYKFEIILSLFQGLRLILVLKKNNFMSLCKPTIKGIRFGRIIISFICFLTIVVAKLKKEGSRLAFVSQMVTEALLYFHQLFHKTISPYPAIYSFVISLIAQYTLKNYEYPDKIEDGNFNIGFQRYHLAKPKFNLSIFYPTLEKLVNSKRVPWLVEKSYMYHPYLSMKDVFKERTGFHLPRFPFKTALHFLSKKTIPVIKNANIIGTENLLFKRRGTSLAVNLGFYDNIGGEPKPMKIKKPQVAQKAFKIMIYCHGFSAHANSSFFLFQDLSSRGWIIISIDFEESLKIKARPEDEVALRGEQLLKRVETLRSVISIIHNEQKYELCPELNDIKQRNPVLNDISAGRIKIDLENLVVLGHSMGGATAILAAMLDSRIKLCIALDPAFLTLPSGMKKTKMNCPFLIINCWKFFRVLLKNMDNDNDLGSFSALDHEFKDFNINCYLKGSHHISQTDFDMFMPGETKLLGMTYSVKDLKFFKEANLVLINLFLENFIDKPRNHWKRGADLLRSYDEIIYRLTGRLETLYFYEDIGLGKIRII